jgi:hypothetical protein
LQRDLIGLDPEEGEMLEDPTKTGQPSLGIPGPTNRVRAETNAYRPGHEPVRNRVRREIEQNPAQQHRADGDRRRVRRSGYDQCETGSQNSQCLQEIAYGYRQPGKRPSVSNWQQYSWNHLI